MALNLLIEPLKTRSGLEPVLRCEPSTYQPINSKLVVFVNDRDTGVVALNLLIGPLKTRSVPRCEPITCQPLRHRAGFFKFELVSPKVTGAKNNDVFLTMSMFTPSKYSPSVFYVH